MLGHGALGVWALGQLPSLQSGAAAAPGAVLPLHLALLAGAASGEGVLPPVVIPGSGWLSYSAIAPGALLELRVSLQPGRARGIDRHEDALASGVVLSFGVTIIAGSATGDAVGYDNDLVMLLAA